MIEFLESRLLMSVGAIDTSFATNGVLLTSLPTYSAAPNGAYGATGQNELTVQPDGKFILIGQDPNGGAAVARFNANGSPDTTFNSTGEITLGGSSEIAFGSAIDGNGRILVIATTGSDWQIFRLNPSGSLDTSFGSAGSTIIDTGGSSDAPRALTIQPDGKIIIAGQNDHDAAIARLNSNGTIDSTFGSSGITTLDFGSPYDYASAVALQSDGNIVLTGSAGGSDFVVARLTTSGQLDSTFAGTGIVRTDFGTVSTEFSFALAIQPDGKILVSGHAIDQPLALAGIGIARYNPDGSLDSTFGTSGKTFALLDDSVIDTCNMILETNGQIILAAAHRLDTDTTNYALEVTRLNSDGSVDTSFGNNGIATPTIPTATTTNQIPRAIAATPDGNLLLLASVGSGNLATGQIGVVKLTADLPQLPPPPSPGPTPTPVPAPPSVTPPSPFSKLPIISKSSKTIQAENFDKGGEGVGYSDSTPGNSSGLYRPGDDVDIVKTKDSSHLAVGSISTGEWLGYTLQLNNSGTYKLGFRLACSGPVTFHLQSDGIDITGPITLASTRSKWKTISIKASLTTGTHQIRIAFDSAPLTSNLQFNYFTIAPPKKKKLAR